MSVPIRKGYHTIDVKKVEELKKKEQRKIIELIEEKYQYCKNCDTKIIVNEQFLREGVKTCSVCKKTARPLVNTISQFKISKINYKQLIKLYAEELNRSIGENSVTFDKERHCWIYVFKGKSIPIVLSKVSSYNQYINNKPDLCWLCIVIDWEANKDKLNNYNVLNFVRIEDIFQHKINLSEQLALIATNFNSNITLELEKKFDEFIKPISGPTFELEFIERFVKAIKEKTVDLEQYLHFLSEQKDTITNSKVVFMGWAGNPDFAVINLHEYLQEALKPDKIGEAKRYHCDNLHSTQFTFNDFSVALAHADGADTLFILSTNNIAPSVWRRVIEKRQNVGYFKHVIIDKDTILLLIKVLGIENFMSTPLTPAKTSKDVK